MVARIWSSIQAPQNALDFIEQAIEKEVKDAAKA
jgi:hypothetical protein